MRIAWLHPDCLNVRWITPGDRAVFVFDDEFLEVAGWGIKRIAFVYECLLELEVEIHHGSVTTLAAESSATGIITMETPDPWWRLRRAELGGPMEILPLSTFVALSGQVDLSRFSRYWKKAELELLAEGPHHDAFEPSSIAERSARLIS